MKVFMMLPYPQVKTSTFGGPERDLPVKLLTLWVVNSLGELILWYHEHIEKGDVYKKKN
jgi:hypothetical protein